MNNFFTLKNPKDNIQILAFRHHALSYSIGVLESKKKALRSNPELNAKIENYLLMEKLSIKESLNNSMLSFDIKKAINNYLNDPVNSDLKNYLNICKHIVAKRLDMNELCSRVELNHHYFTVEGRDLCCIDCDLSTVGDKYSDMEKMFLIGCAKRSKRIIKSSSNPSGNVIPLYSNSDNNSLLKVA